MKVQMEVQKPCESTNGSTYDIRNENTGIISGKNIKKLKLLKINIAILIKK